MLNAWQSVLHILLKQTRWADYCMGTLNKTRSILINSWKLAFLLSLKNCRLWRCVIHITWTQAKTTKQFVTMPFIVNSHTQRRSRFSGWNFGPNTHLTSWNHFRDQFCIHKITYILYRSCLFHRFFENQPPQILAIIYQIF